MKKAFLFFLLIFSMGIFAQDQTINGNLIATGRLRSDEGILNLGTDGLSESAKIYMFIKPKNLTYGEICFRYGTADKKTSIKSTYNESTGGNLQFFTFPNDGIMTSRLLIDGQGNVGIGTIDPLAALDVLGIRSSKDARIFRVLYKNGGNLTNTEFSALTNIPSILADGNNWTALFAKQGSASKAGVFEGDVLITGNIGGERSKLEVNGTIRAQEVKIEATGWSDFVFAKDYQLPSLSDVEKHISENGTLPDIPSEQEVLANGIDVGTMQAKLLQKIEELTLYVIELKKENEAQNKLILQLQKAD